MFTGRRNTLPFTKGFNLNPHIPAKRIYVRFRRVKLPGLTRCYILFKREFVRFVLFLLRSEDGGRGNIYSRSGSFGSLFAFYDKPYGMFSRIKAGDVPDAFGALLACKIVVGIYCPVERSVDQDISFSAIAVPVSFK